jgi:hypothetical protein
MAQSSSVVSELGQTVCVAVDDDAPPRGGPIYGGPPARPWRIEVANLLAQDGVRSPGNPRPIRYGPLATSLETLGLLITVGAPSQGTSVHMPRIGCGLAGGSWDKVEPLIQRHLVDRGIRVFVYDLEVV